MRRQKFRKIQEEGNELENDPSLFKYTGCLASEGRVPVKEVDPRRALNFTVFFWINAGPYKTQNSS